MNYIKSFLIILLIVLTACTGDDTNAPNSPGSVGKLAGIVMNEDGQGISGATVKTEPPFKEVVTGKNGEFVIALIPEGSYTVEASKDGYITAYADAKIAAGYKTTVNLTLKKKNDENNPPAAPHNPVPEDESVTNKTALTLHWECSDPDGDPLTYDVYFDDNNPPAIKKAEGIGDNSLNIDGLQAGKTYYWKVVARDDKGAETSGDVWQFKVVDSNNPPNKPHNPDPPDNGTIRTGEYEFTWECSDPDGDQLFFDFYLANADRDLVLIAKNLRTKHFVYKGFINNKSYHWKVVARDIHGAETSSDIWKFNVKKANRPPVKPFNPDPVINGTVDTTLYRFTWQCYDPDGDTLKYDFYIGLQPGNLDLVKSNIKYRSFVYTHLKDNRTYFWKVVAKDGNGGVTESDIWQFNTRFDWGLVLKDLLAFYPFNGTPEDFGRYKFNGENHGAIPTFDRFNRRDAAYFFSNKNDYIELPNPAQFAFRGDFTIAFWIKPNLDLCTPTGTHIDVINKTGGDPDNAWNIGFTTDLKPEFWVNNEFIGYDIVEMKNLHWQHLAIVFKREGNTGKGMYTLYLNGTIVGREKELPAPTNIVNNVRIGDRIGQNTFGGSLDDVYFFNRALTANDINTIMHRKQ